MTVPHTARMMNTRNPLPRALLIGLAVAVVLSLAAECLARTAHAATAWAEDWSGDLTRWRLDSDPPCWTPNGGTVMAVCGSSALRSKQTWDPSQPWSMTWRMRAKNGFTRGEPEWGYFNAAGGWWHCDDDCGGDYAQASIQYGVAPWNGGTYPTRGYLGGGVDVYRGRYVPWTSDTWQLTSVPRLGRTFVALNGKLVGRYHKTPHGPVRAFVLCVAAGTSQAGTHDISRCEFGPLTVTGTPL